MRRIEFFETDDLADSGIVDRVVDAIELLQSHLDQPINFTRDTDIGFERHSSTAQSSNLVYNILRQTVIRDVVDDNGKTVTCTINRELSANAARCTNNQCHFGVFHSLFYCAPLAFLSGL